MNQIRWISGAPISLASLNEGLVPTTNCDLHLLGKSTSCRGVDVCFGQELLIQEALLQFDGITLPVAGGVAAWCMRNVVTPYDRLRPSYWHPGRSMCTAAHDALQARRLAGRYDGTPKQGHFVLASAISGEQMLIFVEFIFTLRSAEGGDYCFVSGHCYERDHSREVLGVHCYKAQPLKRVVVPLLPNTRLEGASVMPYCFVQGERRAEKAVMLTSHMLVAPRESVSALPEDLGAKLRTLKHGLRERGDEKVRGEAEKTAKRAAKPLSKASSAEAKVRKMKHQELQDALKGRGITCTYGNEHPKRGKPIQAPMCRTLLKAAIAQDGAVAHAAEAGATMARAQAQAQAVPVAVPAAAPAAAAAAPAAAAAAAAAAGAAPAEL